MNCSFRIVGGDQLKMKESIGYARLEFSGSIIDCENRYTTLNLQTSGKQQDYSLWNWENSMFRRSLNWWIIIDEEQPYTDREALLEWAAKRKVNQKNLEPQFSRLPSGFPYVPTSWQLRRTDWRLTRHSILNPFNKPSLFRGFVLRCPGRNAWISIYSNWKASASVVGVHQSFSDDLQVC